MTKSAIEQKSIRGNYPYWVVIILALMFVQLPIIGGQPIRSGHKRLVIHVPVQVKMHHHTHTVYSHIRKGETKQAVYKILGYSNYAKGHHSESGRSGSGRGNVDGGGRGRIYQHSYDDGADYEEDIPHSGHERIIKQSYDHNDYESNRGHGDIIFNHYSRNDDVVEEFPFMESFIDNIDWE